MKIRIKTEGIDIENIGYIKYSELNPHKCPLINPKDDITKEGTDIFTCPKCKAKNCTLTQRQTRSADEAATTITKCNATFVLRQKKMDG